MKVKSAFGVLILALACQLAVGAEAIEPPPTPKSNKLTSEQIAWPMLPGENLKNLSARFFPDDEDMQQAFIDKTIKLNAKSMPDLTAEVFFTNPKAILIPKPNAMRSGVHAIRPAVVDDPSLQYSYGFDTSSLQAPKQKVHPVTLPNTDTDSAQRWLKQTIWTPIVAFCSDLSIDNAKEKLFGNPVGTGGLSLIYQDVLEFFSEQDPLRSLLWLVATSAFLLGVYLPVRAKRRAAQATPLALERMEPIFSVENSQAIEETQKNEAPQGTEQAQQTEPSQEPVITVSLSEVSVETEPVPTETIQTEVKDEASLTTTENLATTENLVEKQGQ